MTLTIERPKTYEKAGQQFRTVHPMEDLLKLCPNPRTIINAGAGAGFFAGECKNTWPAAKVFSFEPVSKLFEQLMAMKHGTAVRCALGDRNGKATINLTAGEKSNSLLRFLPGGPLEIHCTVVGTEQVEMTRLDTFLANHQISDVDILKMDVQGFELAVLRGCPKLLESKPIIYTEVSFQAQYQDHPLVDEVDEFLAAYGYERLYTYETAMPEVWGDAIYVAKQPEIKLNIGAGKTVIPGFVAIDRKLGTEAYPLNYADNSVSDIRASHILEHFDFRQVKQALEEWRRVLKPGGRMRIAVPDAKKVLEGNSENWRFLLMGGQTDADDYHRSAFDEDLLKQYLEEAGMVGVRRWESANTDTAAHPCSLNLECFKPEPTAPESQTIKIMGVMSIPRIGWNDASVAIDATLRPFGIHCERFNGVFWGQCMQRAIEDAIENGVDWILALDYDSMPLPCDLDHMLGVFGSRPDIDALAPLQMGRGGARPLMTRAGETEVEVTGEPIKVHTAAFGMTLLRVDAIKKLKKPWFWSTPDENGGWSPESKTKMDDDIYFWHQWRLAGNNIYVDPYARIGHLELFVSEYDENMEPQRISISDWWKRARKK